MISGYRITLFYVDDIVISCTGNRQTQNKENESNSIELQSNVNVWALGNYQSISTMLPPISAHLIKFTRIDKGESVLDIACGNANTAITAWRKGAVVTGVDIAPELLSVAVEEEKITNVSGIK